GTMYLVSKIKPTLCRPREFAMPDSATCELEKQQGIVFTISVGVNEAASPRHYFHDAIVLAEKQTCRRDAVAAKIVHSTAAGFFRIPKVGAMGASVRLSGTHPQNLPNPAFCHDLPSFHDARRKDLGFGIAMQRGGTSGSPEHGMRLPGC